VRVRDLLLVCEMGPREQYGVKENFGEAGAVVCHVAHESCAIDDRAVNLAIPEVGKKKLAEIRVDASEVEISYTGRARVLV
jgi:hypothetical protein